MQFACWGLPAILSASSRGPRASRAAHHQLQQAARTCSAWLPWWGVHNNIGSQPNERAYWEVKEVRPIDGRKTSLVCIHSCCQSWGLVDDVVDRTEDVGGDATPSQWLLKGVKPPHAALPLLGRLLMQPVVGSLKEPLSAVCKAHDAANTRTYPKASR